MKKLHQLNTILILVVFSAALLGPSVGNVYAGYEVKIVRAAEMASPLGSAFSYQGQLKQNGQPVSVYCDFRFDLYDASSGGNHLGQFVALNLLVSNGLFSTNPDFGSSAFNGEARWLETSVRCPQGSGSYIIVGRQAIYPVPYALYSQNADQLDGQQGAFYQRRVSAECNIGSTIRSIGADGLVVCERFYAFTRSPIATSGDQGKYASIAIGYDGLGLIAYYNNGDLAVAHCTNQACTSATTMILDSGGNGWSGTDITIGSDMFGLIAYSMGNYVKVAHCNNAACSNATITTVDSGQKPSITTGEDGLGLISYAKYLPIPDPVSGLMAAHCNNATCNSLGITPIVQTVDNVWFNSITIGGDGLGLIAYESLYYNSLKLAHCNDAACSSASLSTSLASVNGTGISITTGDDGLGLISFNDWNNIPTVAHCDNPLCTSATVTPLDSSAAGTGQTSIIVGAGGLGLIVYYDSSNQTLKAARCGDEICSTATIYTLDDAGDVGQYNHIANGRDGLGLISYYDATQLDLNVIHCDDVYCKP
jgi:hypothetical protein